MDFGHSPFIDGDVSDVSDVNVNVNDVNFVSSVKKGGSINFANSPALRWGLMAVAIVLCLYLVYNTYTTWKTTRLPGTYEQQMTQLHFNNLHGDAFDDEAKQTIEFGEQIAEPDAFDHYRMGTVYLVNANDHVAAHGHFRHVLNHIINGRVAVQDTPFLLDGIDDYKDQFLNFPDIDELPMQAALMAHYDAAKNVIATARTKHTIKTDDPDFTQKVMLSRQVWKSNSQNVHDSAVSGTITDQFHHVQKSNAGNSSLNSKGYADMCRWLDHRYSDDPVKHGKISSALRMFDNNYPLGVAPETNEQNLLVAVWRRIHDKRNSANYDQLKEALGDSILDCVEGGYLVCMAGRNAKVWQTLAHLDFDPLMGVVKNKQTLRNEIYDRAAKIVDEYVGNSGSASEALKESYRASEDTEQVAEVIECIRDKIDALYADYKGQLPETQLRLLIEECKAVV